MLIGVAVVHHEVSRLTANSSSYDEAFSRNIGRVTLAAEVLKIVERRGDMRCAPRSLQFHASRNKLVTA